MFWREDGATFFEMMKASHYILVISVSAFVSFGFNDSKCDYWRNRKHRDRVFPFSIGTSSTKYSTSSSQFSSSWGACRAFGLREQREIFIAENSDELNLEAAQGSGERLEALAHLSGCDTPKNRAQFKRALQKNLLALYFRADQEQLMELTCFLQPPIS